jgi:exopolyphosphatase/guanosine-5'-triphosphate,3'-diphosphate pyrophosphatase
MSRHQRQGHRLAAVDLGTVTARLLIADVAGGPGAEDGRIHELERHMRITHLGEGLERTGLIGAAAIERERAACADFLAAIKAVGCRDGRPVERVVAVATSAMRDARNSGEVRGALAAAGLEVEVISGRREAQLSFLGTLSGFCADGVHDAGGMRGGRAASGARDGRATRDGQAAHAAHALGDGQAAHAVRDGQAVLVVDVGGGSTELICGVASASPAILTEHSFDIGSRRMTDRFLAADPPSAEGIAQAAAWARQEMQGFFAALEQKPQSLIAVAGTATTAVTVRDGMTEYDPWKVHGARVTAGELDKMLNELAELDLARRSRCAGLEPARAPVIVGGLITLRTVLALSGLGSFTVSETDILHGILLDACGRA